MEDGGRRGALNKEVEAASVNDLRQDSSLLCSAHLVTSGSLTRLEFAIVHPKQRRGNTAPVWSLTVVVAPLALADGLRDPQQAADGVGGAQRVGLRGLGRGDR